MSAQGPPEHPAVPEERRYDRESVERILRAAARREATSPPAAPAVSAAPPALAADDAMTLAEIQEVAAQAGIDPAAIASATLDVALERAHAGSPRMHHVHVVPGELRGDAWDRLADTVRGAASLAVVTRSERALELEIGNRTGERGRLLVNVRSRDGRTTISIWSDAPHLEATDLAACGVLGIPVAIFPVVAASSGHWPAAGWVAGLSALGAAGGAAAGALWRRWAVARWRERIAGILGPVVAQTTALAAEGAGAAARPDPSAPESARR